MNLIYILLSLLGGIALSIQDAINSRLSVDIDDQLIISALISFAVGGVCLFVLALQADWHSLNQNISLQP